ncbi:MAG: hypothetical protein LC109_12470 [Bacteroidia bacterium]|nr:hypothetical protein [Bacteroidia bacterium]
MQVFVYIFQGKYSGKTEFEYKNPEVGAVHKCLIFISQESEHEQYEFAEEEIMKYGFCEIENMMGNLLQVEALNTPAYKNFSGFYEEALNEGSCLVYYPNT